MIVIVVLPPISCLIAVVCLIFLIRSAIKKRTKIYWAMGLCVSLILFAAAVSAAIVYGVGLGTQTKKIIAGGWPWQSNTTITIPGEGYYIKSFSVTSNMQNAWVFGLWSCNNNVQDGIEVLILDNTAYTNWSNSRNFSAIYISGFSAETPAETKTPTTALGTLAPIFTPVSYYLILSNTDSTSPTQVLVSFDLDWYISNWAATRPIPID